MFESYELVKNIFLGILWVPLSKLGYEMSKYLSVQRRLHQILERANFGDNISRRTDIFLTVLVIVNVISVTLESVPRFYMAQSKAFANLEIFSVAVFSLEYLARLWTAPAKGHANIGFILSCKCRLQYIFSFGGIIDLLSILPFYLRSFFPYLDLRVLRALRLLRILKLSNYNSAMEDLFEAIFEERKSLYAALYLFIIVFIVSSSLMYFAENRVHPTGFKSIPDSMYWAMITLTTVGYGDVTPITAAGKFIAVASAVLGVVVVALVTGIIASSFNAQMERRKIIFEEQVRKALLDGILDNSEKEDLEELRKRFGMSKRRADALVEQVKNVRL